jgi:hypothetical protein
MAPIIPMLDTHSIRFKKTLLFYNQTHDYDKTLEHLIASGMNETESTELVNHLKLIHRHKERKTGITLVAIGSFLLVFGFIFSIILHKSNMSVDIALFGPTSIGAILLIWGMAKLF